MKGNWMAGDTAFLIERGLVEEINITAVEDKVIRVKAGSYSWGILDESKLFRTAEEAKQHIKEKVERWKAHHDSKEKLLKFLFDVAVDTHNGEEMIALQDLIQKHFDVRVSYND